VIFKSDMAISLLGTVFTDELHTAVGAAAFSLRDLAEDSGHDYFRNLSINTLAGGAGTLLELGVDYTVSEESTDPPTDLSARVSTAIGVTVHVYKKITIVNPVYQACALYFSGYYHGDAVSSARLNKEKSRYYTLAANTTITSTYGCGKIFCNAGANGIKLTLNFEKGQEIEFIKTDLYATNKSAVTLVAAVAIDGFTVQSGNYYLFLFDQYQRIRLYFDGTQYHITGGCLDYSTGGINTNDWTNRHFGDAVVGYDTQTVAFSIGEKVTAASGNTGIIVWLDATTMIMKKVTGTGIFINNEALTGSWGGAALENVSTKNVDSYIYHNTGLKFSNFNIIGYACANSTFSILTAQKFQDYWVDLVNAKNYGYGLIGIDASNFYIQTCAHGIVFVTAAGDGDVYDTEDYSYNIEIKVCY
jgi:hypothetical protein